MSPLYWPNCDNDNWELMAITMISEEKKGNRIPTNEFCCISIGLISLFIRYQLLFFCSIQFYPEWTRYERQHERHCAYRLESRQRTRFLNFSRAILRKKKTFPLQMDSLWRFGSQNEQVQFDVSAGELRRCGEVGYLLFFLFLLKKLITKRHFLAYFNPNSYPSDADKKVRKYQYQKTYMQYIYHPWYYHWYHVRLCSTGAQPLAEKKNHLIEATTEIKYALEHSSFIWRAAVVFSFINLHPAYFFCALTLFVLKFNALLEWAIATIEAQRESWNWSVSK